MGCYIWYSEEGPRPDAAPPISTHQWPLYQLHIIRCSTITKNLDRCISADFPCFTLDNCKLKFVSQFRYLGHIINDNLTDDDDIEREIKKLFVNTNTLVNRFQRCSHNVKLVLFKSFLYNACMIWLCGNITLLQSII